MSNQFNINLNDLVRYAALTLNLMDFRFCFGYTDRGHPLARRRDREKKPRLHVLSLSCRLASEQVVRLIRACGR